jgi:hypothetical protein
MFKRSGELNVACFGAIRPMKNQLQQALAAMKLADEMKLKLRFHMNGSRIETGGQPVLKNLVALLGPHLIQCDWMELDQLITYLKAEIDIGLQVSMSETFNFVAANYLSAGIPMVVSKEIEWASRFSKTRKDSVEDIARLMKRALFWRCLIRHNQRLLEKSSRAAQKDWVKFCETK